MKKPSLLQRSGLAEDLNFLFTNRIPRITLTHAMGWFSQIKSPLLTRMSIAVWRWFTPLDFSEAKEQRFESLHACFTRELKPGARPYSTEPNLIASPSDGIVGAMGRVQDGEVFQAKGFPYTLSDLLGSAALAEQYRHGHYLTLRLTSAMYHRFHAPARVRLERVNYISGDTWNVNPIALKRVERLFCRNERAVLRTRLHRGGHEIALVPVAAILVASMRFHFLDVLLHLRYRGPHELPCNAVVSKGQELGWFQHGSTIIVFAPAGFTLCPGVEEGTSIRMGEPLMSLPSSVTDL